MPNELLRLLDFLWMSFLLLSPMLLLGLLVAGLIHVLISREAIQGWLSGDNLKAVCASAAIGVPMPLCSCSVVPVVAEMRRKGASRSSCMSILITAPETGADSILVTHAFFGFVAAVVRPIVSFVTAVAAGICCIGLVRQDHDPSKSDAAEHGSGHSSHDHDSCDHDHDHGAHVPLTAGAADCYVSLSELKEMLLGWLSSLSQRFSVRSRVANTNWREDHLPDSEAPKPVSDAEQETLTLRRVFKHVIRYGFVEIADDILFALLLGVTFGGLLYLALPDDLMSSEYARWISYPVMVIVGVPMYICASASTPIAAALVAKGLSPGAALIFLMTGPATNSGTIAVIASQFGARFGTVYVGGVVSVTAILGILIDTAMIAAGLTLPLNLAASHDPAVQLVQWAAALALIALIIWRFSEGALKRGWDDLVSNITPLIGRRKSA